MRKKITPTALRILIFGYIIAFSMFPIAINFFHTPVMADGGNESAVDISPPSSQPQQVITQEVSTDTSDNQKGDYSVQTVLSAYKSAVIAAPMDGVLVEFPLKSGDAFKKNDILAQFKCDLESSKVQEIQARLRVSTRQLEAFKRLKKLDAVADIEFVSVQEGYRQDNALLEQAKARQNLCLVVAPFDGSVNKTMANNFEAIKSGRVLMEVSSSDPLKADFLIPSIWLQWINIGHPLDVYITESDKTYSAKIIRIHGQVDPVTKTIHAEAMLNKYQEELLPGMSGLASIYKEPEHFNTVGFLGLNLGNKNAPEK